MSFVNTREFPDVKWGTPQPIIVRNPGMGLGVALLQAFGNYSFFVSNPQQFVTQVVGAQGVYGLSEIQGRLRTILLSKLADMFGELGTKGGRSVLDIIGLTEEIQGGVRAKAQEDFLALGVTLKTFGIESIKPSEKSAEELRAMGMLDMATYTQLQAADAMRDAARNPLRRRRPHRRHRRRHWHRQHHGPGAAGRHDQQRPGRHGQPQQQQPQGGGGGGGAAPAVMSPTEAANYLKVAESDVMTMITDGTLKSKKIGTQIRISKQALDDFLNS